MRKLFKNNIICCGVIQMKNYKIQHLERCLKTIIDLDIKRIVYSSKNDTFMSGNPKI